jgi:hypothetical protein
MDVTFAEIAALAADSLSNRLPIDVTFADTPSSLPATDVTFAEIPARAADSLSSLPPTDARFALRALAAALTVSA